MEIRPLVVPFSELTLADVPRVGAKNAAIGEMTRALTPRGVRVPEGFATTVDAFRLFAVRDGLETRITRRLRGLDPRDAEALARAGSAVRAAILAQALPAELAAAITDAYRQLGPHLDVAAWCSHACEEEDETFLHVRGETALLDAVRRCFASVYADRAIATWADHGLSGELSVSVGVQRMVRADLACAGVMFSPEGSDVVMVQGAWGPGRAVAEGIVEADQFGVHKPTLRQGYRPVLAKSLGGKEQRVVYENGGIRRVPVPERDRTRFVLADDEVLTLARWACAVEDHHAEPGASFDMDWAKDGRTGELFLLRARPGTRYAARVLPPPTLLPRVRGGSRTKVMVNVANPRDAFRLARLPSDGVGLLRIEPVVSGWIGVHPLALLELVALEPDLRARIAAAARGWEPGPDWFVERLAEGIATVAAAFWPRDVIVRFSDFNTDEYAHLLGGDRYEPLEHNPMLGFRGASRYYDVRFRAAFELECRAIRRVRSEMGLSNVKAMVPFCRTPAEGRKVLAEMARAGLARGEDGFEVHVMCELPANVELAEELAEVFDGFSIGSEDLTQLVLGVDRGAEKVAALFDERDPAVTRMISRLIRAAHARGRKVSLCGQAPSHHPEFLRFLVREGIDAVSLDPESVEAAAAAVVEAEREEAVEPEEMAMS